MDVDPKYKMNFTISSEEVEAREDFNRKRTDKNQILLDYKELNESYSTRVPTLSDDYFHSYSEEELYKN